MQSTEDDWNDAGMIISCSLVSAAWPLRLDAMTSQKCFWKCNYRDRGEESGSGFNPCHGFSCYIKLHCTNCFHEFLLWMKIKVFVYSTNFYSGCILSWSSMDHDGSLPSDSARFGCFPFSEAPGAGGTGRCGFQLFFVRNATRSLAKEMLQPPFAWANRRIKQFFGASGPEGLLVNADAHINYYESYSSRFRPLETKNRSNNFFQPLFAKKWTTITKACFSNVPGRWGKSAPSQSFSSCHDPAANLWHAHRTQSLFCYAVMRRHAKIDSWFLIAFHYQHHNTSAIKQARPEDNSQSQHLRAKEQSTFALDTAATPVNLELGPNYIPVQFISIYHW